jgi:rSAM/selenodomain-associated transferase 1
MKQPDLLLFAKQPVPGQVKTRLQPQCTPERAAEVAAVMIRATVEVATSFWPGDVFLYGAPDTDHPLFRELAETFHLSLANQGPGNLGDRMDRALADGVKRSGAAAVMGCDVPHCRWDTLELAHDHLSRGNNVVGPTADGGYYLIGVQRADPSLFHNVNWGGNDVLLRTAANAAKLGITLELLPILRDVDTWEDLVAVARECAPLKPFVENP